jgi:hypothetical protein
MRAKPKTTADSREDRVLFQMRFGARADDPDVQRLCRTWKLLGALYAMSNRFAPDGPAKPPVVTIHPPSPSELQH